MTAEVLLVILLAAAFVLAAGLAALLLAAFGPGAWIAILALALVAGLVLRFATAREERGGERRGGYSPGGPPDAELRRH